ncbi:uncharacterized protein N7498_010778 [Penicillium cinerascens]|uniref:DUF7728 domain-containing protein n=1 Tax=Penicillium cinerascens TaxID=70096 RepID=A0A9W9J812_9EURO|nr:uncharacterized protein N7498_010778 [Penicillium cinerascens]KAJ5191793.1 hypothetical protein N7498_010778 [Penicillium cinerascens]
MYVRSILLGGAAALGASAMLVIPEMEPQVEAVEDGFMNIHPLLLEDTRHAIVDLPCTECPVRQVDEEGAVSWADGKPSSLMLDFSIEDNRLLANGRQIFPPVAPSPIDVIQEIEDGEVAGPMPVGYALEVMPLPTSDDPTAADLLNVRFTILDLETHPVPVDTVAITLIQDPAGQLYIAKTEIDETASPTDRLSWKKCNGKPKCLQKLLISRVRGLLAAAKERIMGMGPGSKAGRKGCHGKPKGLKGMLGMGGHHKHHDEAGPEGMSFHDFEGPKGHHHHGHFDSESADRPPHHMHHGHHRGAFAHTFSRIVRFILVPAVLGVLAGLTASAVGMLFGQAVVFLWQRYRGTKSQEHMAAWEQGEACEKQGLMAETEEVLPEYIEESSQTRESMDKN